MSDVKSKSVRLEEGIPFLPNVEEMSRSDLKDLCIKHGIRANIKTDEMKVILKRLSKGKKVDAKYFKISWVENNKARLTAGGSVGALLFIAFIVIFIFLNPTSNNSLAPSFNTTVN